MCVCVCVCVLCGEGERERKRKLKSEWEIVSEGGRAWKGVKTADIRKNEKKGMGGGSHI